MFTLNDQRTIAPLTKLQTTSGKGKAKVSKQDVLAILNDNEKSNDEKAGAIVSLMAEAKDSNSKALAKELQAAQRTAELAADKRDKVTTQLIHGSHGHSSYCFLYSVVMLLAQVTNLGSLCTLDPATLNSPAGSRLGIPSSLLCADKWSTTALTCSQRRSRSCTE